MVARHWTLSSYLSVMPRRGEGGVDVTARSMSYMKEGFNASKDLWEETNSTTSALRWEARRQNMHVAHVPTHPAAAGPGKSGKHDSRPHASVYTSVTLLSFLSILLERSRYGQSALAKNKGGVRYPQCDAYCSLQLQEMSNRG